MFYQLHKAGMRDLLHLLNHYRIARDVVVTGLGVPCCFLPLIIFAYWANVQYLTGYVGVH
jgi:hypothetical protein